LLENLDLDQAKYNLVTQAIQSEYHDRSWVNSYQTINSNLFSITTNRKQKYGKRIMNIYRFGIEDVGVSR